MKRKGSTRGRVDPQLQVPQKKHRKLEMTKNMCCTRNEMQALAQKGRRRRAREGEVKKERERGKADPHQRGGEG